MDTVEIPCKGKNCTVQTAPGTSNSSPPQKSVLKPTSNNNYAKPTSTSDKSAPKAAQPPEVTSAPTHPFATSGNSYLPPHNCNFTAKAPKDKEVAYRTMVPIQSPTIINDVFSKTMKTSCVTLSPKEIMSISLDV